MTTCLTIDIIIEASSQLPNQPRPEFLLRLASTVTTGLGAHQRCGLRRLLGRCCRRLDAGRTDRASLGRRTRGYLDLASGSDGRPAARGRWRSGLLQSRRPLSASEVSIALSPGRRTSDLHRHLLLLLLARFL